jgi:hypothetical protein
MMMDEGATVDSSWLTSLLAIKKKDKDKHE